MLKEEIWQKAAELVVRGVVGGAAATRSKLDIKGELLKEIRKIHEGSIRLTLVSATACILYECERRGLEVTSNEKIVSYLGIKQKVLSRQLRKLRRKKVEEKEDFVKVASLKHVLDIMGRLNIDESIKNKIVEDCSKYITLALKHSHMLEHMPKPKTFAAIICFSVCKHHSLKMSHILWRRASGVSIEALSRGSAPKIKRMVDDLYERGF